MSLPHKALALVGFAMLLSSCTIGNGRICGPQTPAAYCDAEAYEELIHPKGFGYTWERQDTAPGSDVWRQDWVACGGFKNGSYGIDVPQYSPHAVISAADEKKLQELAACMKAKGYHFTGTWRTF